MLLPGKTQAPSWTGGDSWVEVPALWRSCQRKLRPQRSFLDMSDGQGGLAVVVGSSRGPTGDRAGCSRFLRCWEASRWPTGTFLVLLGLVLVWR